MTFGMELSLFDEIFFGRIARLSVANGLLGIPLVLINFYSIFFPKFCV